MVMMIGEYNPLIYCPPTNPSQQVTQPSRLNINVPTLLCYLSSCGPHGGSLVDGEEGDLTESFNTVCMGLYTYAWLQTCGMIAPECEWIYMGRIGKIFQTDRCAMVAIYLHWHLPFLGSHVAVTLSPSLCTDLPGCQRHYKSRQGKGIKEWINYLPYTTVQAHESHSRSVQLNGDRLWDLVDREIIPPLAGGKNLCRPHLYLAEMQRRDEVKRRDGKQDTKGNAWTGSISSVPPTSELILHWPSIPLVLPTMSYAKIYISWHRTL